MLSKLDFCTHLAKVIEEKAMDNNSPRKIIDPPYDLIELLDVLSLYYF